MLNAIDICGGAGGWAVAARGLPIRIEASVDFAEDCCNTYRYNHSEVSVACEDVRAHNFAKYTDVDLVLGAIPCEEISVARMNMPTSPEAMEQWRELLSNVLCAVEQISPRWWCLENVIQMRRYLPPLTPQMILDSSSWSGQRRRRIYAGKFPRPTCDLYARKSLSDYLVPGPFIVQEKILACTETTRGQWYSANKKRVVDPDSPSPTVTDFGSRHSRGFCIAMPDGRERSLQFTEAAQLQGFPSNYTFVASQTRAWKMVAQAIQIDTARAILKGILVEAGLRVEKRSS